MKKPALFVLLWICAGISAASAQTVTPTAITRAPEIEWSMAVTALILLSGAIAIMRGRRKH